MPEIPTRWKGACENGTEFNSSMCNRKLIGARYFSKGIFAEDPHGNITMKSPRDICRHGTHCAATSAGSYVDGAAYGGYALGVARGMAPRARLAMYKSHFDRGTEHGITSACDVLAAIDQAIIDEVDILSLSVGEFSTFYENPLAAGTYAAMERGIFVSMAAGNDGTIGSVGNDFPWVLTVGAGTIDRGFRGTLALANGVTVHGLSLYAGKPIYKETPIIDMKMRQNMDELRKVHHMIVVCRQKENSSSLEELRALVWMLEGFTGAVFISNYSDFEFDDAFATNYPALIVTSERGKAILDYTDSISKPKARMLFGETSTGTKPAPKVASFSSRGPSMDFPFVLKPDVIAPGVQILAAWSPEHWFGDIHSKKIYGAFKFESGTSMAAPHAAGIGALLKAAHPDWSPAAIKSAILTTANVLDNTGQPIKDMASGDQTANPLAMGSGHLNVNEALDPGLIYNVTAIDYINLLCSMNLTREQIILIVRSSNFSCANASLDLNYPSFIALYESEREDLMIREFKRTVTNLGVAETRYNAVVKAPQDCNVTVSPTVLKFTRKNEEQSYTLSIAYGGKKNGTVTFGYLNWVEENGNHTVMSPIVISPFGKNENK